MEFCCVSVCWRAYRRNKKDNSEKKTVLYVGFQLKQTRVTIQLILTVRLIITVELPNYQQKRVEKVVRNKRRSMSSAHFLCRIVCKWECVSEWVPSNNIDIRCRYFRYYVGKNIYFVLLYVYNPHGSASFAARCGCRICLFLAARVCFCMSVSVSCQHCWFGIRFVLFLYWYIMEEFELPWAIIFSISLLVCCSGWCSHYSVVCVCVWECINSFVRVRVFVWEKQLKLSN